MIRQGRYDVLTKGSEVIGMLKTTGAKTGLRRMPFQVAETKILHFELRVIVLQASVSADPAANTNAVEAQPTLRMPRPGFL